jgi:hypothetical protein
VLETNVYNRTGEHGQTNNQDGDELEAAARADEIDVESLLEIVERIFNPDRARCIRIV